MAVYFLQEDDFEGFTKKDVHKSERKLKEILAQCEDSDDVTLESPKSTGTRITTTRESLDSLPASERTRNREKTVVRKSYQELIKQGLIQPSKPYTVKPAREETKAALKIKLKMTKVKSDRPRKSLDNKSVKFDLTPKGPKKGRPSLEKLGKKSGVVEIKVKKGKKDRDKFSDGVPPYGRKKDKVQSSKVMKDPKNLAKQLLQKARKGQKITKTSVKMKSPITSPKSPRSQPYNRKQFVLPTQSSRSSRVIIPNKRFLEDDSYTPLMVKRSRIDEIPLGTKYDSFLMTCPLVKISTESPKVKATQPVDSHQVTMATSIAPGPAVPPLPPGYAFDGFNGRYIYIV